MSSEGSAARPCRVILVGMMGSGKSTIGRLLSEATGWPYVDNDDLVRESHGATSRQLLAERGEAAMREAESAALARGLGVPEPAIIGVAAGTILDARNRERLDQGGIVVWLRADAETLAARAGGADHRPWIDAGGESWFVDAVKARDPLYAAVSDIVVDASDAPAAIADELQHRLREHPACR